jgi:diguanylate cyclase (GGDEF)-like protein
MEILSATSSTSSAPLLIGLAVASVGLVLGTAVGRRIRRKKISPKQSHIEIPLPIDESRTLNPLTDLLTGLANHRAFDAELAAQISKFQQDPIPFCLLLLDVDHFKQFNDIHDQLAGDDVLRTVGRTLKTTVRAADFVARYGGEKFAIMMPETTLARAMESAQRVRIAMEMAMSEFGGRKLKVTVSIGVAEIASGQTAADLVQCAGEALYAAKQTGRNQVQQYCPPTKEPSAPAAVLPPENGREKACQQLSGPTATKPLSNRTAIVPRHQTPVIETRTDAQTGLPNRTAFCEEIRRRLSEAQRHGNRLSLMLIKIDNLGQLIRERCPSDADLILRTCAQFFTAAMRDMDLVVRYGRDMFGIMLPGTSLVNATGVGHRLRTTIQQCPLRLPDGEIHFTLSAGVAEAQPGEDLMSLLNRAEQAKTAAASGAGNDVRFHNGIAVESIAEKEKEPAVA